MRRLLPPLLLTVTAGCQTMSALGRVVEQAAYPTAGAVGGAALGGPAGAAGGAAAGHLVGRAVAQESAPQGVPGGVERIFVEPTVEALFWVPLFGVPMWAWMVIVAYVLHRLPWLPAYVLGRLRATRQAPEDTHGKEEGSRARGHRKPGAEGEA